MNKDDMEFFKSFNRRVNFPLIVDPVRPTPFLLTSIVTATFRAESIWNCFYPTNQNAVLMPFLVDGHMYSIEIGTEIYENIPDKVFENKIKKEVAEIKSGKEKFYFTKLVGKFNLKDEITQLKEKFLKENPNSSCIHCDWKTPTHYLIVGRDKSHLARTTIFVTA